MSGVTRPPPKGPPPEGLPPEGPPTDPHAALMDEGDRLARHLTQTLHATLRDQPRLTFLGRSLALNLVNAFMPTLEHVTRRAGHPLRAALTLDDRARPLIHTATPDGEPGPSVSVDDLLRDLLFLRGGLHPAVQEHLRGALSGSEHHATRALVDCLRSRPVLDAMQRQIQTLMRAV
ncbi:hypothetical protein GCM10008959_07950 [Deinococcus seoulensis]|uniref:Uncharacterized protein n=1 Tax=Deinococcus seoulensis TaxID=1837379 RepID=A0ABQ2RPE3_9DEIO|nr:hypothetical protein GCM10008959_07950 [Deinococcus seoulensis]